MHLTFTIIGLFGVFLAIALTLYDGSSAGKNVMNVVFDRQASETNQEQLDNDDSIISYDVDDMVE